MLMTYRSLFCIPGSLLLFFHLTAFGQDSSEVEGEIGSVTVFFSGAEITRKGKAELNAGQNVLIFKGLSPSIEESSIQLDGGKGLHIRSIEKRLKRRAAEGELKERIKAKKDSLEQIEFKLSQRKSMREVYREERSMILENKNIKGKQTGVDIENLMELAIYYRKRLKDIEYKLIEVNNELEDLQKERNALDKRIRTLERKGRKKRSRILISLEAESRSEKTFKLSYFSPKAGWKPAYELNCPSLGESVNLTYKGEVWQQTGKDWKEVDLTLASGKPTRSGDQPELDPWRLKFRKEYDKRSSYQQQGAAKGKAKKQEVMQQQNLAGKGQNMRKRSASLTESDEESSPPSTDQGGAVHTRFPIESTYSIPSGRSSRSVTIKELEIDASHDHLAVPKLEKEAFLIAKLSGWEATDLFPGQASVQYAGRYVGNTHIDPNITEDTLEVSMGRDQGVVVDRKKVQDKTSEQVIGGKKVLEMGIEIELKNKRSEGIDLRVKDQLPLTSRGDVEVSLDKSSGASYDKDSGELKWRVSLEEGASKTLHFAYTIKYPKELDPVGL
ncbi:MAG: DUF4139 domain-containing protein [Flavobacteriales bacterium]